MFDRLTEMLKFALKMGIIRLPKDFSEPEIREALRTLVKLANIIADLTQTQVDDEWVAKLQAVVENDELFHAFYLVVKWTIGQFQPTPPTPVYAIALDVRTLAAAEAKLDPQLLVYAKIIAELLWRWLFGEEAPKA